MSRPLRQESAYPRRTRIPRFCLRLRLHDLRSRRVCIDRTLRTTSHCVAIAE